MGHDLAVSNGFPAQLLDEIPIRDSHLRAGGLRRPSFARRKMYGKISIFDTISGGHTAVSSKSKPTMVCKHTGMLVVVYAVGVYRGS